MKLRMGLGVGALLLFVCAVNVMVWTQAFFSLWVCGLLLGAVICGGSWLALLFLSGLDRSSLEGRTLGGVNAVLSSGVFLAICVVLYAFTCVWGVSLDLTREGRRDLAPQTIQVLQALTKEVQVTCFFLDIDDELILIAREKAMRFLDQCSEYTDLLKVEVLDPQVAMNRLESMDVAMASAQGTVVIQQGTRKQVIRLSGGSPRLEEREFTNSLVNVLRDSEPKIYFLTGHGERRLEDADSQKGLGKLAEALTREGYQVESLGIKISEPQIPADCDILLIGNLGGDLHPQEITALKAYVRRGGRFFIALDPWVRANAASSREHFRPWLEEAFGVHAGSDIILTQPNQPSYAVELRPDNAPFTHIDEDFMMFRGCFNAEHPIMQGFNEVMLLQAVRTISPVEELPAGVVVNKLLRTTPDFWAETAVAKYAQTGDAKPDLGEPQGVLTVAVAAVRRCEDAMEGAPKDARLVVVGDSDFMSNTQVTYPGHMNFVLNTMAWLTESEELIAIRPTGKEDPPLVLTTRQERSVVWVSTLLTVQLVMLAGLGVYFLRRKNR